eukprot:GHVR01042575.1.p1 GENE.GHVR01042575.1~~GHVR01042575.1.p1  ORF type:complete len:629 (-),score=161.09 GHVR01042575.1:188-2074(-)
MNKTGVLRSIRHLSSMPLQRVQSAWGGYNYNNKYNNINNNKNKNKNILPTAIVCGTTIATLYNYFNNNNNNNVLCDSNNYDTSVDVVLGNLSDFTEGEMYDISVFGGRGSVLLAFVDGKIHCVGPSCTHYSAPLVKGVVTKTHVSCPWHDAEFSLTTGMCVNGPGFDAIPVYKVKVNDKGEVVAQLPLELKEMVKPKYAKRNPDNKTTYVIVGGGAAACAAAETMRQEGFEGRIVVLSEEPWCPYDRPVLSKNLYAEVADFTLRDDTFFDAIGVELMKSNKVLSVDPTTKTIEIQGGGNMKYDKCLVCTGAAPRRIPVSGHESSNIHVIRTPEDREGIVPYAKKGVNVVVVGSSFVGMEAAASLARKGACVTVVGMETVPFERSLGIHVGSVFAKLLAENGIDYRPNSVLQKYKTEKGKVTSVEIKNKEGVMKSLKADAVVLGAGVIPNTSMLKKIDLNQDRSVTADSFFQVKGTTDMYVAGDIVRFPFWMSGRDTRIEHWDVAIQQGRIAASNMVNGNNKVYKDTPFFWTLIFGHSIRYAGHGGDYNEVFIEGSVEGFSFVAYYLRGDKVVAVATIGKDPVGVCVCEAFKMGIMPTGTQLKAGLKNSKTIADDVKERQKRQPKSISA